MSSLVALLSAVVIATVLLFVAACDDGSEQPATPTPRPLPSPVAVAEEPAEGFSLGDPALEPLPGATVDTGRYKGAVYQIEMPDQWNGRLVMYIHGNDLDTTLYAYPPAFRPWLIKRGYAWATSSFSVNVSVVNGIAADETAALWDHFVSKYGRPNRTYVTGISMGGAASFTAAERYADRFDGALAQCGDALPNDWAGDLYVIAAYAAGLTQEEYERLGPGPALDQRILPALEDEATRTRFEDIWVDRSGGPRVFGREGLQEAPDVIWTYALTNVLGSYTNVTKEYAFGPSAGVTDEDFNRGVVRVPAANPPDQYAEGNAVTGDLQIPTIAMQTTGDVETPFSEVQVYAERAAAGKADLLVTRAIRDPRHCGNNGFTIDEVGRAIDDLVAWVEEGKKPEGEDLLGDLTFAGTAFTSAPRYGSPEADDLPGAGDALVLSGAITFDAQPVDDGFLWATVERDGFVKECSYRFPKLDGGRYELAVAAATQAAGCGEAGATVHLQYFRDGAYYAAEQALTWPQTGGEVSFDAIFSTADPAGSLPVEHADFFGGVYSGELRTEDGRAAPPGTVVEAYVRDLLCGRFTASPVVLVFEQPGIYSVSAGGGGNSNCREGTTVTFRVNDEPVDVTAPNGYDPEGHVIDLEVP